MRSRSVFRFLGGGAAVGVAAYAAYGLLAWLRYGHLKQCSPKEADPLLDWFMPKYDVVARHTISIEVPAEVALAAACDMSFDRSIIIRATFKTRELVLGGRAGSHVFAGGLLEQMKRIGWSQIADVPGREIVMGSATQPWRPNPTFLTLTPEQFESFHAPGYVKIIWNLRADPLTSATCVFRTETRVLACGSAARSKFRRYWAFLSPGIILIRIALLRQLKASALRKFSA